MHVPRGMQRDRWTKKSSNFGMKWHELRSADGLLAAIKAAAQRATLPHGRATHWSPSQELLNHRSMLLSLGH
jgi:hypothetical protein